MYSISHTVLTRIWNIFELASQCGAELLKSLKGKKKKEVDPK